MTNHPNRSKKSITNPVRWSDLCRAMYLMGYLKDDFKTECLGLALAVQDRIKAGKVVRLSRGLYQVASAHPKMDEKIAKITESFSMLGGIGHTSDARRAIQSPDSDYLLQEMIERGLLTKVAFDTYQLEHFC